MTDRDPPDDGSEFFENFEESEPMTIVDENYTTGIRIARALHKKFRLDFDRIEKLDPEEQEFEIELQDFDRILVELGLMEGMPFDHEIGSLLRKGLVATRNEMRVRMNHISSIGGYGPKAPPFKLEIPADRFGQRFHSTAPLIVTLIDKSSRDLIGKNMVSLLRYVVNQHIRDTKQVSRLQQEIEERRTRGENVTKLVETLEDMRSFQEEKLPVMLQVVDALQRALHITHTTNQRTKRLTKRFERYVKEDDRKVRFARRKRLRDLRQQDAKRRAEKTNTKESTQSRKKGSPTS